MKAKYGPASGENALNMLNRELIKFCYGERTTHRCGYRIEVEVSRADGATFIFTALWEADTVNEMEYYRNGGILQYTLRKLAA